MKKRNLEERSMEEILQKLKKFEESDAGHFLYNFMSGSVLYSRGKYRSAQEILLAKCFYCQALEHDGEAGDCPNTDCPLFRSMCQKKYTGKDREVYP